MLFILLFTLSLLATIGLFVQLPYLAQVSAPTTQAEFIQVIEQQAKKDYDNGLSRKDEIDTILGETYTDNEFGVGSLTIRQVYDEAYSAAEDANKPGLLARLVPEDGVVIGSLILVAGIIGAVLKDTVTQWIKTIYQGINKWIYERFAGTRLFEKVALRRYRSKLFETYQELKIPFRVNRPPLNMEEIFVPLKVAGADNNSEIDSYQCLIQHKRLVVKGPPGSGKTMLLNNIVLSYSTGRLHTLLVNRPLPVLLELHRINNPDLTPNQLIEALVEAFKRNDFPTAERFIEQSLKSGKLLLLLDGLDEVSREARVIVTRRINDLLRQYNNCRAIITCRTQVYCGEFDAIADQTLEIVEFSDQQIRRFLESWKQKMPPEKSINQLMQTLRDRPRIMALARNPLLLTIIAYLYTDTPFVLPHSRAEFYQKSTDILLDQWQKDFNQYQANDKRRVLQHLALYNQDQGMASRQDRRSIDYEKILAELRNVLPALNLSPDSAKPILDEIVERSGLFLKIDNGERYQFAHLTLQEYFSAVALSDRPDELIYRFEQDPNIWREVVKLWCGLAGDSTKLIEAICVLDLLIGFECLADAQEVDPAVSEKIINYYKHQVDKQNRYDKSLANAFGSVAASFRPRGRDIFEFLKSVLQQEQEPGGRQLLAAAALAKTNLPEAASVLAANYGKLDEISRLPFLNMGDITVPALKNIWETEHDQKSLKAAAGLCSIGTPDAANAIVEVLLNSEQEELQTQAAWCLAALMHRPSIEDSLKNYIWPSDRVEPREYIWLWNPFLSDHSTGFRTLISKIALQLKKAPRKFFYRRTFRRS